MDKAKETFLKVFGNLKEKWGGFSRAIRIGIIASAGAVVLAIIIVVAISSNTGYVTLFEGQTSDEREEVTKILADELGITEWRINGNRIEISSELESETRWALAMRGYPKSSYGFSHYNDQIDMLSTESDKQEYLRQNLSYNIKATLEKIPEVRQALVNISPVKESNYVISTTEMTSSASVMLELVQGKSLTSDQIEGIYNIVLTAYYGFSRDRINITDGNGIMLVPNDGTTSADDLAALNQQYKMMLDFKSNYETKLEADLEELFAPFVKQVSVNVAATLDFGSTHSESVVYTPSVDEEGNRGGMVSEETDSIAAGGMTPEGGLVGTTNDADIAPDFPTLIADEDSEIFYERLKEIKYLVNQEVTSYDSAPFTVKQLSASVALDASNLTPDEEERFEQFVATAIGTLVDNVTVIGTPYNQSGGSISGDIPVPVQPGRNILIFIIVMLGALLIVLFFLAILTASSKKKRLVRSKLAPVGGFEGGMSGGVQGSDDAPIFGNISAQKVGEAEGDEPFKLQSLLAHDGESREAALKAEIREFAKSNPEIVAQLIRTWMKEVV